MNTENTVLKAQNIFNVAYGTNTQQVMDIYLPENRNKSTKTFILVHGGGWSGGSKEQLNFIIPILKSAFPDYAIANLNYRLASMDSPAFPKQIQDLEKAIQFLNESNFSISQNYAFIGISAGAHLAMLYSYKFDTAHNVKAIANIVGPADFTDPYYTAHPYYHFAALYLLGEAGTTPYTAIGVSPALFVNAQSPATIMFYGGKDQMVPPSQAKRLKAKLDDYNVPNEYHLYANGGHTGWNQHVMSDFEDKLIAFLQQHLK